MEPSMRTRMSVYIFHSPQGRDTTFTSPGRVRLSFLMLRRSPTRVLWVLDPTRGPTGSSSSATKSMTMDSCIVCAPLIDFLACGTETIHLYHLPKNKPCQKSLLNNCT